jgi:hypothetical protein
MPPTSSSITPKYDTVIPEDMMAFIASLDIVEDIL